MPARSLRIQSSLRRLASSIKHAPSCYCCALLFLIHHDKAIQVSSEKKGQPSQGKSSSGKTKRKLNFAAALATADYNVDYVASNLHQRLGILYTHILHEHLTRKDKRMDKPRTKKMRNKLLQRDIFYSPGGQ